MSFIAAVGKNQMPDLLGHNMDDRDDVAMLADTEPSTNTLPVVAHRGAELAHNATAATTVVLLVAAAKRRVTYFAITYSSVKHAALSNLREKWRGKKQLLIFDS
jgi:hypothetical protein